MPVDPLEFYLLPVEQPGVAFALDTAHADFAGAHIFAGGDYQRVQIGILRAPQSGIREVERQFGFPVLCRFYNFKTADLRQP